MEKFYRPKEKDALRHEIVNNSYFPILNVFLKYPNRTSSENFSLWEEQLEETISSHQDFYNQEWFREDIAHHSFLIGKTDIFYKPVQASVLIPTIELLYQLGYEIGEKKSIDAVREDIFSVMHRMEFKTRPILTIAARKFCNSYIANNTYRQFTEVLYTGMERRLAGYKDTPTSLSIFDKGLTDINLDPTENS